MEIRVWPSSGSQPRFVYSLALGGITGGWYGLAAISWTGRFQTASAVAAYRVFSCSRT